MTSHVYTPALNGAKTRDGGIVTNASSELQTANVSDKNDPKRVVASIARVGDIVEYEDGTTAKIISGAGMACTTGEPPLPLALIGSELDNGDVIIANPYHCGIAINEFKDKPSEGFLVKNWKPS